MTSANLSNQGEIYSYDLLCTTFANVLETGEAKFIGQTLDLVPRPPSEIFQFDGERTDKIVLRPYSIAHG